MAVVDHSHLQHYVVVYLSIPRIHETDSSIISIRYTRLAFHTASRDATLPSRTLALRFERRILPLQTGASVKHIFDPGGVFRLGSCY